MKLLANLFRGPAKRVEAQNVGDKLPVAYAEWSCLSDEESCDACKRLDGLVWVPSLVSVAGPPCHGCSSREGCRCEIVYVMKDSAGAPETAEFIRQLGGRAEPGRVRDFWQAKRAPLLKKRENQRLAADKALMASSLEENDPTQALALYRESIQILLEASRVLPDRWDLRDIPRFYYRLTLVLERTGDYEAALAELVAYEGLRCSEFATKSQREALCKRKDLLLQRVAKARERSSKP